MKKLVFVAMLLIVSIAILTGCKKEDGIITGIVTDASTGEPVSNANVKLKPRGETTLTGSDGTFQFNNLPDGTYSLSVSKNGYVDLDDDYAIEIKNGLGIRRDIQIASLKESFILTVNGVEISTLDFGIDPSLTRLSFSINNNGTVPLMDDYMSISASVNWITPHCNFGIYYHDSLMPNNGYAVYVEISRLRLQVGENIGSLSVSVGSLTKILTVNAVGVDTPIVTDPVISNNNSGHSLVASASITSDGGYPITEKGFEYICADRDTWINETSCGSGNNEFSAQLEERLHGWGITKVRSFASNGVHTGYSNWVYIDK